MRLFDTNTTFTYRQIPTIECDDKVVFHLSISVETNGSRSQSQGQGLQLSSPLSKCTERRVFTFFKDIKHIQMRQSLKHTDFLTR